MIKFYGDFHRFNNTSSVLVTWQQKWHGVTRQYKCNPKSEGVICGLFLTFNTVRSNLYVNKLVDTHHFLWCHLAVASGLTLWGAPGLCAEACIYCVHIWVCVYALTLSGHIFIRRIGWIKKKSKGTNRYCYSSFWVTWLTDAKCNCGIHITGCPVNTSTCWYQSRLYWDLFGWCTPLILPYEYFTAVKVSISSFSLHSTVENWYCKDKDKDKVEQSSNEALSQ